MKSLNKELNLKQEIILLFLVVVLLILCYVQFVDRPLKEEKASVSNQIIEAEDERDFVQTKLTNIKLMKQRMKELKKLGNLSYMPSYNASEEEINILNDVLADTKDYSISFADVTKKGNQIRRNFTINFSVSEYMDAVKILSKLSKSKDRCMVSSVACNTNLERVSQEYSSLITVSATATFYETMVGGKKDLGLTEEQDENTQNQEDNEQKQNP